MTATNPFRFGSLARDEAFTDRDEEIAELVADARNGQDVVIFAPRRYGKSSLVDRVAQTLVTRKFLVGQVNLMKTPTAAKLADKLAGVVYEDVSGAAGRVKELSSRVFRGLRITPTVTVNPEDGSLSFSFGASHRSEDVDATLERLLELVAELAAERERPAVLIFDEFQEIVDIDPQLPKLMRSVFQEQPDVAHFYLGSKRHMMERIFSDANEPFWRSAKKIELGPIGAEPFGAFLDERFRATGKRIAPEAVGRLLEITHGHPYATQELAYFLWEGTRPRAQAGAAALEVALDGVLRSEYAHFSLLWDRASSAQRQVLQALAAEPGRPMTEAYRSRQPLPSVASTQKALEALERQELVGRRRGEAWIAEPFLAEWVRLNAS
jgi:AAA+ ATPase superfamily predicted ATPase